MAYPTSARPLFAGLALLVGAAVPATVTGQERGTIVGTVREVMGLPLLGVEVLIPGSSLHARTDLQGEFRIANVPLGQVAVHARRLGFRTDSLSAVVLAGSEARVSFRLHAAALPLEPLVVRAVRRRYTGRLAGFHERMASGTGGVFLTRERIEQGNSRDLSNVLRTVPGVEVQRGGRIRMRGRNCAPLLWIDGLAMPAGEVDINTFPPSTVEGIELYLSAMGAPIRYQGTRAQSSCGTILIWSRGPDTELRRRPALASAASLEQRHARQTVFAAAEVDEAARLDSTVPLEVIYPPELIAERVSGLVIAEMVVDSLGRMEPETFGILSSSHPLFTRAVQMALEVARFIPARAGDRAVPQIVQLPFRFEPPERGWRGT